MFKPLRYSSKDCFVMRLRGVLGRGDPDPHVAGAIWATTDPGPALRQVKKDLEDVVADILRETLPGGPNLIEADASAKTLLEENGAHARLGRCPGCANYGPTGRCAPAGPAAGARPATLANYLGGDGMAEEWWSTMSQCSPLLT